MVIPGSQILIYPILWILMPSEQTVMANLYASHSGSMATAGVLPGTGTSRSVTGT
jgi:hypothetical protein